MFVAIVVILSLVVVFLIAFYKWNKHKLKVYSEHNLIVFGEKGSGKSLIFSCIAKLTKYGYISNTDFGHNKPHYLIRPSDIKVGDNTAEDFLNDNVKPFEKVIEWERKTVLLDDAGIYLPSWCDNLLKRNYPGMPAAFATWRHFYDAPIHINSQDIERAWKLLREQQGRYIYCKRTIKLPFGFFIVVANGYNIQSTASAMMEPMKDSFMNKYQKANGAQYSATNGKIEKMFIFGRFKHHIYDSRYFHKTCFGCPAPNKKEFKQLYRLEKKVYKASKREGLIK